MHGILFFLHDLDGKIIDINQHAYESLGFTKNELLELEILKHVESTPLLNTRMAASKLGCSVKLAHVLLGKMVVKRLLHVKKIHSRRWDYFLTTKGVAEKIRCSFFALAMQTSLQSTGIRLNSQKTRIFL